ncbi:MAG: winged helix-turn-helix domain-containing protein [Phaeodactylibacter sp.]|nr:winged helix-turn-helix domain-containing protein [Phaeodactylibacter sp.]MCB9302227.1 winged helix-turn-helix domain-containing protein [Lewinellaceae bacterium]
MPPRKIAVFGGEVEEVERILELIPKGYEIEKPPVSPRPGQNPNKEQPVLAIVLRAQGWNTIRKVAERYRNIPILAIASQPSPQEVIEAFREGARDFLIYPLQDEEFRAVFFDLAREGGNNDHYYSKNQDRVTKGQPRLRAWFSRLAQWLGRSGPGKPWEADTRYPLATTLAGGVVSKVYYTPLVETGSRRQPNLDVALFGPLTIKLAGLPIKKLPGKKVNALLAYFLYYHHKPAHRDILMEKFWGNHSPSSARNSLNVAIYALRKHLHKALPDTDVLLYDNDYYQLNPELDIVTDVERFLAHWQRGRTLETTHGLSQAVKSYQLAAGLYTGEFLSGLPYDEWCELERDNLKETYLFILDRLSTYFFQEADYTTTARICTQMLEKDPCLEDVHRKLIIACYQLGHRDKAVRQYYKCAKILRRELDVDPSPQTQSLFEHISKGKLEIAHTP